MYILLPKLIEHVYRCTEITCADGRTDGQSVRAETAAVNMKGDTQRTAADSKHSAICTSQKTVSAPNGAKCACKLQHFVPPTQTHPQNVLTMTP